MACAILGLVVTLALAPTALASHPSWFLDKRWNLDGDRALERVVAEYDVSLDHKYERATIDVIERCAGKALRNTLAAPGRSLDRELILRSTRLGRPGVAFAMTYPDGSSIARIVQLRPRRPGACRTPVAIFSYSSKRPPYPPPDGYWVDGIRLEPGEHSAIYPGKELLLTEEYASRRLDPVRRTRRSYFRYAGAKRAYVAYRTELTPKPV